MIWVVILLIVITALLATIVGLLISASQVGLRQDIANLRAEISGLKSTAPGDARRTKARRIADELAQVEILIKTLMQQTALMKDRERERRNNDELGAISRQLEEYAEKVSEMRDAVCSLFE